MLQHRSAFKFLLQMSGCLLLAAIVAPVFTFVVWREGIFLHKMQAEGIDTKATITSAWVSRKHGSTQPTGVTFDIAWTDREGHEHKYKGKSPSLDYSMQLLTPDGRAAFYAPSSPDYKPYAPYALTVKEVPLRYLASDPEQFILSADPSTSAGDMDRMLPWSIAGSILALANVPFFYRFRRIYKRRWSF